MTITKRALISLFILLNFLGMVRVFAPMKSRYISTLYWPVDKYLSFFSIYQDWYMFAPNPGKNNYFISAEVEFEDGTIARYEFPRSANMNIFEKYHNGEKYRKMISEGIRKDTNKFLWQDTAKFALRKLKSEFYQKMPLKVHLYRHWDEILPPHENFKIHSSPAANFQSFKFYTYEVL